MPVLRDKDGQLKMYYHGTQRVFDHFRPNELGLIHFSENKNQAEEFALYARGASDLPKGPKRVIGVHLLVNNLFDTQNPEMLFELSERLDWEGVVRELEEFSQSPWDVEQAQKWLKEGQWQLMELPCVLGNIKQHFDGMVMHEMGVRNVAVFSPSQIEVVGLDFLDEPRAGLKR